MLEQFKRFVTEKQIKVHYLAIGSELDKNFFNGVI